MGTLRHCIALLLIFFANVLFAAIQFQPSVVQKQIWIPLQQNPEAVGINLIQPGNKDKEISFKGSLSRDCNGVSIYPMNVENVTTPVQISVKFNGSSYQHAESFTCTFSVKTITEEKTSIKINIAVVSELCNYYLDPVAYCHSNISIHSHCNTNGTCACDQDYFGKGCATHCDSSTCSNRGQCTSEGQCECHQSYFGPHCEYQSCSVNCSVHGKCNNVTGKCDCEKNYFGSTCSTLCDKKTCGEYGHCDIETGACLCNENWFGSRCQNHCNATTCGSHGSCDQDGGCLCNDNYYGSECEVMCLASSCGHGLCNVTSGSCICQQNYFGAACDVYCDNSTTCHDRGYCRYDGYCECDDLLYFGYGCEINKLVFGAAVAGSAILVIIIFGVIVVVKKKMSANTGYELLTPEDHSLN